MLSLLAPHQGSVLDLLWGLQHSADPLVISSCLRHKKRPSTFYKLNLEHKNGGMRKCLGKSILIYLSIYFYIYIYIIYIYYIYIYIIYIYILYIYILYIYIYIYIYEIIHKKYGCIGFLQN